MFGSGAIGISGSALDTKSNSSAAGRFVGGALVGVEATLGASSALESRLSFFADCFLLRERKGRKDVLGVLAFRRAGSEAVGSSSCSINRGKRAFEEDEAEDSAMVR